MKELDREAESFRLHYEKFLIGCEAVAEEGWDTEVLGEMGDYYTGMLLRIILRTVEADGWVSDQETRYVNDLFGFTYTNEELESVYESTANLLHSSEFDDELIGAIAMLESRGEKLCEAYRALIAQICTLIARSDGFFTEEEKAEIAKIQELIGA
ncbi:MAG: TerB family tellurite resistance protein [Oscillospiraceae bacterium]|nr:TerB family tellurite resistance protein [Oscillospiraceae bacterium]